jgi:hypothetical protein
MFPTVAETLGEVCICGTEQWHTERRGRGGWGVYTPRNSEALPKLSQIPSSVKYTPITT